MVDKAFKPLVPYDAKFNTPEEEKKDFNQTWIEFSSKKRVQIVRETSRNTSGGTIIYTVKDNEILFITSAWMVSATTGTDIFQIAQLEISDKNRGNLSNIFSIRHNPSVRTINSPISSSFNTPIKVESGNNIELVNQGANITTNAGFIGFVVPFTS